MSRTRPRSTACAASAVFLILAVMAAIPALAGAATFTVNTTADQAPSPSECSGVAGPCGLRQAIDKANSTPGADSILLPAGHYSLTIAGSGEDAVGDLNVTEGELSISGSGARQSIIDASAIGNRVFEVKPGTSLSLSGLSVTGGRTEKSGGGISVEKAALNLDGVSVSGNESFNSGEGGGINGEDADIAIRNSSISGNRNSGDGGGIDAEGGEENFLSIENSTIANNVVDTSLYPGNPGWGAYGGAMEVFIGHFELKNVTISGNSIRDGNGGEKGNGAAISAEPRAGEKISVINTIVYGNTATLTEESGECYKTLTSEGHNLEGLEPVGEPRCFETATDLIANPLLGPLADNGGETDTMALMSGSPAIDAGDAGRCPASDQRGVKRPQFAGCDIGAFELAPPPPSPAPTPTPTPAPTPVPVKPSTGTLKVRGVKRDLKKGTATILASVSGPGTVTLSGKKVVRVKRNSRGVQTVKLTVRPKGEAKKSLIEEGKVKVGIKVLFAPSGGGATVKKAKSVVLKEQTT